MMCNWSVFESFYQLLAGLMFGYAVGATTFFLNIDKHLFKSYSVTLNDYKKAYLVKVQNDAEKAEYKNIHKQKINALVGNVDVVHKEIINIRERYQLFFFLSFFVCLVPLIISGYEQHMIEKTNQYQIIHKSLCVAMFMNFLLIWAFCFVIWRRKKTLNQVAKEFETRRHISILHIEQEKFAVIIIIWLFLSIMAFYSANFTFSNSGSELDNWFSENHFSFIFLFSLLSASLPFILQKINVDHCKAVYDSHFRQVLVPNTEIYTKKIKIQRRLGT